MKGKDAIQLSSIASLGQLSPEAFQHQDDRKAAEAVCSVPVFPQIVKLFAGELHEKVMRLHHLSHCIRVSPRQAVELNRHYVHAARILSMPEIPELYISPEYTMNAFAMGVKRPVIVVTRGLLDSMTTPEITAVLAHELGHVKCGHMVNRTIASMIAMFGVMGISQLIPVLGSAAMLAVAAPLCYWSRMAELSCDRAALLVVREARIIAGTLAKLGGWPRSFGEVDFPSLREQTDEYDRLDDDTVASIVKVISLIQSDIYLSHPLPINRVHRILQWSESDQYRRILAGDYKHKEGELPPRTCEACGQVLGATDLNCTNCSREADAATAGPACTQCGYPIPNPRPRFCGRCGHSLTSPGSATA